MPASEENTSVSLAWGKLLLGIAAMIFSVSSALSAQEWWQFVFAGVLVLLGVVLLVSGSRDLIARMRESRLPQDDVV
jgi:ABC-type phosphate transport system permease subunit